MLLKYVKLGVLLELWCKYFQGLMTIRDQKGQEHIIFIKKIYAKSGSSTIASFKIKTTVKINENFRYEND